MSKKKSEGDLELLLANIDQQLLLKLLDALVDEQTINAPSTKE